MFGRFFGHRSGEHSEGKNTTEPVRRGNEEQEHDDATPKGASAVQDSEILQATCHASKPRWPIEFAQKRPGYLNQR